MKKIKSLIFILPLLLILTSCNSDMTTTIQNKEIQNDKEICQFLDWISSDTYTELIKTEYDEKELNQLTSIRKYLYKRKISSIYNNQWCIINNNGKSETVTSFEELDTVDNPLYIIVKDLKFRNKRIKDEEEIRERPIFVPHIN